MILSRFLQNFNIGNGYVNNAFVMVTYKISSQIYTRPYIHPNGVKEKKTYFLGCGRDPMLFLAKLSVPKIQPEWILPTIICEFSWDHSIRSLYIMTPLPRGRLLYISHDSLWIKYKSKPSGKRIRYKWNFRTVVVNDRDSI